MREAVLTLMTSIRFFDKKTPAIAGVFQKMHRDLLIEATATETLVEAIYPAARVHNLLLARVKGMTFAAHVQ